MKKKGLLIIAMTLFLFHGCGGNSQHSNYQCKMDTTYEYGEGTTREDSDEPELLSLKLTGVIETCNKCKGYGMVQDGFYGIPQTCKFCWVSTWMRIQEGWTGFDGRYGQVDAVFNSLPADYFDGLNWNDGDTGGINGEQSIDQIEAEISRLEENITQLEQMIEYIDGSVNRMRLQQMIIEEQYEIKRLKQLLDN